ncbi:hypothetical protein Halru_0859 [Halovivax ruber XH-70]|uniref:Uncharacterized protein n=1 Tax=Halovivax ruber (strain DSM 18193 / JCM 13892 / XH-70) TaxID=797302 RepID=L0I9I4_HALRX|nr:hypothetical protein [Halovivax ruber]AGB15483.1 hypothetical protein Halru_0859 [Halovivax ruber XH-70]
MGVRPPQGGDDTEPETIEFGIAAVDARLRDADLDFPASADAVDSALGDRPVPYDPAGSTVSLSEALAEVDTSSFDSRQELLNELHPVFEAYRANRGASLIGRLRGLLPF